MGSKAEHRQQPIRWGSKPAKTTARPSPLYPPRTPAPATPTSPPQILLLICQSYRAQPQTSLGPPISPMPSYSPADLSMLQFGEQTEQGGHNHQTRSAPAACPTGALSSTKGGDVRANAPGSPSSPVWRPLTCCQRIEATDCWSVYLLVRNSDIHFVFLGQPRLPALLELRRGDVKDHGDQSFPRSKCGLSAQQ